MKGSIAAAAKKGDAVKVRALLEAGHDVHKADPKGYTALRHAAERGHAGVIGVLLEHGAGDHEKYSTQTVLHAAARMGRVDAVRVLIEAGAEPSPALYAAARKNHVDVLEVLLDAGADPDTENDDDPPPLFTGNEATTRLLLARGADPNHRSRDGSYALEWHVQGADPGGALALIDHGLDLEVRHPRLYGMTPLMVALHCGQYEPARALLDRGADLTVTDERGYSVFDLAIDGAFREGNWSARARKGCRRFVEDVREAGRLPLRAQARFALRAGDVSALRDCLDQGLPVDTRLADWTRFLSLDPFARIGALFDDAAGRAREDQGKTAPTLLMWAAALGHVEQVRCLLERGANPDLEDDHEYRARDYARYRKHGEVFALLESE